MTPVRKYNFLDSFLFCFVYNIFAVLYLRIRLFALLTAGKRNGTGVYAEISFHEFHHFSFYLFIYFIFILFFLYFLFTHDIYPHPHPRPTTCTHDPRPTTFSYTPSPRSAKQVSKSFSTNSPVASLGLPRPES